MSPQKSSEFVKAWAEYRRNGGKEKIGVFAKHWKAIPTTEIVHEQDGESDACSALPVQA